MENTTKKEIDSAKATFLAWERTSRDTIDFKRIYVDMCNDIIAGLVLSQIIYWHLPDANGKTKLQISHNGELWIAKTRHEWWSEIRVGPRQLDRALAILEKCGLVESSVHRFNGSPTKHVRLIYETVLPRIHNLSINPPKNPYLLSDGTENGNNESGISPIGNMEMLDSVKSLTETTTEITTKTDSDSLEDLDSKTLSFAENAKEKKDDPKMNLDPIPEIDPASSPEPDSLLQSGSAQSVIVSDIPNTSDSSIATRVARAKSNVVVAQADATRRFHTQAIVDPVSPFKKADPAKPIQTGAEKPVIHDNGVTTALTDALAKAQANQAQRVNGTTERYYPVDKTKKRIGPVYASKDEADAKAPGLSKLGFVIMSSTELNADSSYKSYLHIDKNGAPISKKSVKEKKPHVFTKTAYYAVDHVHQRIAAHAYSQREWKKVKNDSEFEGYELIIGEKLNADPIYREYEYKTLERKPNELFDAIEKACCLKNATGGIVGQIINWLAEQREITSADAAEDTELIKDVKTAIKWFVEDSNPKQRMSPPQYLPTFIRVWNSWQASKTNEGKSILDGMTGIPQSPNYQPDL